jgi:DNA topoisomerase VI subunit B
MHALLLADKHLRPCSKNISIHFARRTDVMPAAPQETKYHPSAVDLLLIKRLIAETTKQTLGQFLVAEFDTIRKPLAERLVGELLLLKCRTDFAGLSCPELERGLQVSELCLPRRIVNRFRSFFGGLELLSKKNATDLTHQSLSNLRRRSVATKSGELEVASGSK